MAFAQIRQGHVFVEFGFSYNIEIGDFMGRWTLVLASIGFLSSAVANVCDDAKGPAVEGVWTVLESDEPKHLAFALVEVDRKETAPAVGAKTCEISYEGLYVEGGSGAGWPVVHHPWEADKCVGTAKKGEKELTCRFAISNKIAKDVDKPRLVVREWDSTECMKYKTAKKITSCPKPNKACVCFSVADDGTPEAPGTGTGGSGGD